MNARLAVLTLALLWAGVAYPQTANLPGGTVLESSVETSTDLVLFPRSTAGKIQARACAACSAKLLQLDGSTKFNLAGQQVTLAQMSAYCSGVSGKSLTIHYRLSDSIVSLVSVLQK